MRRRKKSVQWFPNLGSDFVGDAGGYPTTCQFLELVPDPDDSVGPTITNGNLLCVPVTTDYTEQPDQANAAQTLRDFVEGQDYLLRRIVGKCFVNVQATPGTQTATQSWPSVIVTAGFMVARALDADQTAIGLDDAECDPFDRNNIMQPWIWRRQWHLGDPGNTQYAQGGSWRQNNSAFATMRDGPEIDTKIARRITKEHRLWFCASAFGVSPFDILMTLPAANQPRVHLELDIRVLGSMRRGKNHSVF